MVELSELDYKPKPIDGDFLSQTSEYPVTGHSRGARSKELKVHGVSMQIVTPILRVLASTEKKLHWTGKLVLQMVSARTSVPSMFSDGS